MPCRIFYLVNALGHTYVKAIFYNPMEYVEYVQGKRVLESVRRVDLEALVDTGATFPALPKDMVEELGLPIIGDGEAEVAAGKEKVKLALGVTQIEDRTAGSYMMVRLKGTTPLIGVVALEQMGYKVDPTTGKLIKGLPLMLYPQKRRFSIFDLATKRLSLNGNFFSRGNIINSRLQVLLLIPPTVARLASAFAADSKVKGHSSIWSLYKT